MKFERLYTIYTSPDQPVENQIKWKTTNAKITDKDNKTIFEMSNIEVPAHWSQTATNIIAQKYFRKAGIPQKEELAPVEDHVNVPEWLRRSDRIPDYFRHTGDINLGSETSAKQVFHRLAGCWTYWGWKEGIFKEGDPLTAESYQCADLNARIFYDELYYMLAMQIGAPNSPQWFNTGLHWAYGIKGSDSGQWYVDYEGDSQTPPGCIYPSTEGYKYPQPHACFIQPVSDDLVNPGGIMDLWTREVRLFKHGSGTGTNFSNIRAKGEPLSGGGKSSGLMSFLKIGDVSAGAVQSGGTTRRAAKMVCLDLDHPEIEDFIKWKTREERKARAMSIGSQFLSLGGQIFDETKLNEGTIILKYQSDNGEIYSDDFEGEAINSVSGQNSNNSVRVTDEFLDAVDKDNKWCLTARTFGNVVKTLHARDLWKDICDSAWTCADPGVQFHDTINTWHTCKADGPINASNPCSEYMFLDNTACNLASLNLCTFLSGDSVFDVRAFEHSVRLFTVVLEISVYMASFPSKEIAEGSYNYRTLGLGYANLGGLLLRNKLSYDSDEGRDYAASITALMHGVAYKTSSEMAKELGTFPRWEANKDSMRKVLKKHYFDVMNLDFSNPIVDYSADVWRSFTLNEGFRNAQVTLLAPTGTIALLMDCDTTGIEPFMAPKIIKKLAGGGTMDIENLNVPESECALGKNGLRPMAHVLMVAAVQPFLSGAVSKTVNLPNSATVEDIDQIYREAHRLGLKAIAVYRDGSKMTQPMNTNDKKVMQNLSTNENNRNPDLQKAYDDYWSAHTREEEKDAYERILKFGGKDAYPSDSREEYHLSQSEQNIMKKALRKSVRVLDPKPTNQRSPLPMRREGYTQKLRVEDQVLYLRTGNYPDGSLGEIFVTLSREGSTVRSLMESFGKAISIGLQFGVPLREFVDAFTHTKFEPSGVVQGHDRIKMCSSIIDLIFRDLAVEYLNQDDLAHVKPNGKIKPDRNHLDDLIQKSQLAISKMSNEEKEIMLQIQKESFVRGQVGMGSDRDEANERDKQGELDLLTSEPQSKNTGDLCHVCGNMSVIRVGTCTMCLNCNDNTGCG